MMRNFIIQSVVFLPILSDAVAYPESQLQEDLFRNYNKKIRPVLDASDRVIVFLGISIGRIESLVSTDYTTE